MSWVSVRQTFKSLLFSDDDLSRDNRGMSDVANMNKHDHE